MPVKLVNSDDLRRLSAKIESLPRARLAHLPTPLEEMPRLAAQLGGPRLFVKRDDCTGLGLGGNKIRKLEFEMAAALDALIASCAEAYCNPTPRARLPPLVQSLAWSAIWVLCTTAFLTLRLAMN
jgi:hypothetical protein